MSWFGLNIKGKKVSYRVIEDLLKPYCNNIIHKDISYLIPDNPEYVMKKSPASKYTYGKHEGKDCDDAVRIFRGWLSQKGYGNVLAMDVKIFHPRIRYHALIGFWHNNKLILGEPQTGKLNVYKNSIIKRIIL